MSGELINPRQQFLDDDGNPVANGTLTFYVNLTSTLTTVYSDEDLTIPQSNPYTLDASGCTLGDIKHRSKIRVVLKDASGATIRTTDNVASISRYQEDHGTVSIFKYMTTSQIDDVIANTGLIDVTGAWNSAYAASKSVYFPAGTYSITNVELEAGQTMKTDGFSTVIKRGSGSSNTVSTIKIVGSNVTVESFSAIGDIATATLEFNHIIFCNPDSATGAISNITIGDVTASNVRGDVVYLGANTGYPLKNVSVGRVHGSNILRNVVSITGGDGITIVGATGTDVGYFTLDIEPEPYNTPVTNMLIGYVIGKVFGCQGSSASAYSDNIRIGVIDVHPTDYGYNSTPAYGSGGLWPNGVVLRNVKSINIGMLKGSDFNSFLLKTEYNAGELGAQDVNISNINASNCSVTDVTYNSYIDTQNIQRFTCESLVIDASATTGKSVFLYGPNIKITNVNSVLGTNGIFARLADKVNIENGTVTGTGTLLSLVTSGIISNITFTGATLAYNCPPLIFNNIIATCSGSIFSASYELHYINGGTINATSYPSMIPGNLGIGLTSGAPTAPVDISGNGIRIRTSRTPASATATGNAGEVCWDASYIYVCVASNTWRRSAILVW